MDPRQFEEMMQSDFAEVAKLLQTKGADYSRVEDAFHNFKHSAEAMGLTPGQVWGVFAGKHWEAIMRYVRDGAVSSEPIEGRILDLILYGFLLLGMVREGSANGAN